MIDAASGGALVDKTPKSARLLISNMAANSQQFSIRNDPPPQPKKVNEVSIASLEQKFDKLTSLVQQLSIGNMKQIKLRAFPFSLADSAKEWLYYLPSGTITTCILGKIFPSI